MATAYDADSLQMLVLTQINTIKGLQTSFEQSEEAYDEAVRECGFSCPVSTDDDKEKKYQWLIQRMRRWYMWQLLQQYILRFKAGDMEAQQIVKNLNTLVMQLDKEFEIAKSAPETSDLFLEAENIYGSGALVIGTGLIEDRIGESTEDRT